MSESPPANCAQKSNSWRRALTAVWLGAFTVIGCGGKVTSNPQSFAHSGDAGDADAGDADAGDADAGDAGGRTPEGPNTAPQMALDEYEEPTPAPPFSLVTELTPLPTEDCGDFPPCDGSAEERCTMRCFRMSESCKSAVEFVPVGRGVPIEYNHVPHAEFAYFTWETSGPAGLYAMGRFSARGGPLPSPLFADRDSQDQGRMFWGAATETEVLLMTPGERPPSGSSAYRWVPGQLAAEPLELAAPHLSKDGKLLVGWAEEPDDLVMQTQDGTIVALGLTPHLAPADGARTMFVPNNGRVVINILSDEYGDDVYARGENGPWEKLERQELPQEVLGPQPAPGDDELIAHAPTLRFFRAVFVTDDGATVGGEYGFHTNRSLQVSRPFRWTEETGLVLIEHPAVPVDAFYTDTLYSENGRVIAGVIEPAPYTTIPFPPIVYRYSDAVGVQTVFEGALATSLTLDDISETGAIIFHEYDRSAQESTYYRFAPNQELVELPPVSDVSQRGDLLASREQLISLSDAIDPGDLSALLQGDWTPPGYTGHRISKLSDDGRLLFATGASDSDLPTTFILRRQEICDD